MAPHESRLGLAYPDAQVSPIHLDDIAEMAADLLTREEALAAPGLPESVREVLLEVMAAAVDVPATVRTITGHPARTFREWALANRAAF